MLESKFVKAAACWKILDMLRDAGCDARKLAGPAPIGLAPVESSPIRDGDKRISYARLIELYQEAASQTDDEAFGLHIAEYVNPAMFDVIGYAAMYSPTLGAALERVSRYYGIWTDGSAYRFRISGSRVHISFDYLAEVHSDNTTQECDSSIASLVCLGRKLTATYWNPLEVRFQHGPPRTMLEYERVFRCVVKFNQPHNEMVVDRCLFDQPVSSSDPWLCGVLDRHAAEMLRNSPSPAWLIQDVKLLLAAALRTGDAGLKGVAKELGMSPRTLQRRLSEHGVSHQSLLDEVRRDLSRKYLLETEMVFGEVAYLLGFSEVSAFHRAFRRWTGLTPKDYRRKFGISTQTTGG
jgi:AraC-like DNA-binding protein